MTASRCCPTAPGCSDPGRTSPTIRPAHAGVDLVWPSAYRTWDERVRDAYFGRSGPHHPAHARLFQAGPEPGPTIVAIHGYGAGHVWFERRLWPVKAWNKAGVDVVLPALPFHGRRAEPGRELRPRFPTFDPRLTHEGFRQAVHDLTALIRWLRARGHGPIGLAGMSLGGHTAALLATLEPDLACAVLIVPLASIADFARAHGHLGEGPVADELYDGLEAVYRAVSPVARPPHVDRDRVWVAAARGDRITGVEHAERLAAHFGTRPRIGAGGHRLRIGIAWAEAVRFTAERLR
jgi:pimeloyl-ACP methyl ester carboxylesterase